MFLGTGHSSTAARVQESVVFTDYLWTPPTTQDDLANGRPNLFCHILLFSILVVNLHQFPKAVPSLRSNTGLEDEHDESCGVDVED